MGQKCVSVFLGTFFLVLTVGLNVAGGSPAGALSIGASLMCIGVGFCQRYRRGRWHGLVGGEAEGRMFWIAPPPACAANPPATDLKIAFLLPAAAAGQAAVDAVRELVWTELGLAQAKFLQVEDGVLLVLYLGTGVDPDPRSGGWVGSKVGAVAWVPRNRCNASSSPLAELAWLGSSNQGDAACSPLSEWAPDTWGASVPW